MYGINQYLIRTYTRFSTIFLPGSKHLLKASAILNCRYFVTPTISNTKSVYILPRNYILFTRPQIRLHNVHLLFINLVKILNTQCFNFVDIKLFQWFFYEDSFSVSAKHRFPVPPSIVPVSFIELFRQSLLTQNRSHPQNVFERSVKIKTY